MKRLAKAPVTFYKYVLSPWLGGNCRFHPTCSSYALEAVERHGAVKGWALAVRRICKCHPFYKGPCCDEVPERFDWAGLIGYKRPIQKQHKG